MSVNLLELAKNYLSEDVVSKVSNMLGETEPDTQKAFDGALPAILNGLVQKSAEPGGASSVMDMIGQATTPDRTAGDVIEPIGGLSGNLNSLLTDNLQSGSLLSMGAGMIQSLFGDRASAITGALASYSGIKQTSASSLMSIAGPVLLSVLGKKMADGEQGVSGLGSLLSSQASAVKEALPSEFGSLLAIIPGLGLMGKSGTATPGDNPTTTPFESITPVTPPLSTTPVEPPVPVAPAVAYTPPAEPVKPLVPPITNVPPVTPVGSSTPPVYNRNEEPVSGSGNQWLPWLLLLLGAVALFFVLRSCRQNGTDTTKAAADSVGTSMNDAATTVGATADSVGSNVGAAADSAGSAVSDATAKLGAFFKRKLPSGLELNIPEKGIENNLVTFIEDKSRPVDKTTWFNFDRLLFDTGKATLRPESKEQVNNMAAILKEYPNVAIKLGGYTDNTGSAALNKKLSQDRANTVMSSLIQLGIDKARLEAEGYGPEHPVATNDTEAGRAENRRIAVRVTKK